MPHSARNADNPVRYAGILRRLGAFSYDIILLIAVLFLATAVLMPFTRGAIQPGNITFLVYILVVIFLFFGWFWTHGGQTLGMRAWKIRLELDNGHSLGWSQALLRLFLGIMTFGIGLLWCLWDERYRALYDVLARTQVIRVDKVYVPPID
jgi:uncharacterized RDD family membrane protein YckC